MLLNLTVCYKAEGCPPETRVFGEALSFYEVVCNKRDIIRLVVFQQLQQVEKELCTLRGIWVENGELGVFPISKVVDVVGIWESDKSNWVYILRKHPGVDVLTLEERDVSQPAQD
jgi:hypothetical protein